MRLNKIKYPKGCKQSAAYLASDGCGSGWNADIVPDNILGVDIKECCKIHDYLYTIGKLERDRYRADKMFLKNMLKLIHNDSNLILRPARITMAHVYYLAVRNCGSSAFWEGKR